MGELVKTQVPGYSKDPRSGAVLNTDGNALSAYKARAARLRTDRERISRLERDVQELKEGVQAILGILRETRG